MAKAYELERLAGQAVLISRSTADTGKAWFRVGCAVGPNLVLMAETAEATYFGRSLAENGEVTVGYADAAGFFAAPARVHRYDVGQRMLTVSNPSRLPLHRRRSVERVAVALPVQWVWPVAAGDAVREATTIDISARGLAMRTDAAVAEGQDITLLLRLPGHDVLAVGRVLRAAGPDEATRVRLDQMAPEDKTRLTAFLDKAAKQSSARRIAQ